MKKHLGLQFSACALIVILAATSVSASPVGSIAGSVKDPSGALVPGAKLTLTNVATNSRMEAASDANGTFQFLQLAPTVYSLVVEAPGFKKFTAGNVLVQVDQITHVDVVLEVGAVAETVEVAGVTPLLESEKSTLSSVVDTKVIANMPLNARQFLDLALLTPGVLPTAAGTQAGSINVAGARAQSNVWLLDGVSNIDTQVNGGLQAFRITDAVQEFAVQTSVATAEFGRGTGGQVSVVTKSGTNQFHGSAFEYLRNSNFDAADFFTNRARGVKNPLHRNQYGATFGGPILKDRLFFFTSWEGFRQVAPTVSSTRVPTDAERATVTDPISQRVLQFWPKPNATVPGSANNFVSNPSASTFDNTGLARVDFNFRERDHINARWIEFQARTFTAGALPLLGGTGNEPSSRNGMVAYTHTFSPKLLNEFRFGYSRNTTFVTVQDSGFDASTIFVGSNGQPLPGVVNGKQNVLDSGLPRITVTGGFAALGTTSNIPQGRITNTYEIFDNVSLAAPFGASKHSFRWGFHIRREEARRFLNGSTRGVFAFSSFADFANGLVNTSDFRTGSTLAYWLRYPFDLYWQDTYKIKNNLTLNYGLRYEYPSALYQTRRDATNFIPGVGPVLLDSNQLLALDPTKLGRASLSLATAPRKVSNSGVISDKNNFAPVVGLAYTPRIGEKLFGHDATVIRAGFRVGYDEIFNNIPANMGLNPPFNLLTRQAAGVTQPAKFPWAIGFNQNVPLVSNFGKQGPGTPTVGKLSFNSEDPNLRSAYLYQYSFGVQRKLGNDFSLEVDYQGSTGHKLGIFVDQNQPTVIVNNPAVRGALAPNEQIFPFPFFSTVSEGKDITNSNYNGMVVTGKYQGRRGLTLQAWYTVGKSLDNVSAFFGTLTQPASELSSPASSANLRLERGPSAFDIRHRAVISYVIDLPVGPGHRLLGSNNGVSRQVFGGWQISGITTLQTGSPFTVFNTAQDFSGFNQFADRPDKICAGRLPQDNGNVDSAFDKTCFPSNPPTGRVGTSGRNPYHGPSLQNYNFAVLKGFSLVGENRVALKFRADFFNLFNHTNFSLPNGEQSSANFGKITSTLGSATATAVGTSAGLVGGGPRIIQFSLRLEF